MKKRIRFWKILNLLFYCVAMDFYSYKYRKCKNKNRAAPPLELMCINVYNKDKEDNTMPMTSKEMIKLLEANGFIYVKSGDGSHRKFRNPKTGRVTQVPFHNRALGKGLEHRILKQAGLK